MPITPLHYPVAWGLSKLNKKLNLPGLIVGSFIPDIEYLFYFIFFPGFIPDYFLLHSLIGGAILGTIISVISIIFIYPLLTSLFFGLDKTRVTEVCRLSPILVLSCILGSLFHIILDVFMHRFNSILWPFVDPYNIPGIFSFAFAFIFEGNIGLGAIWASILLHTIFAVLMIVLFVKSRRNLWDQTRSNARLSFDHRRCFR